MRSLTGACALLLCTVVSSQDAQRSAASSLHLQFATFDPVAGAPEVPALLRGNAATQLWIVQFEGAPTDARREAVRQAGGEVLSYLPDNAYVVRMESGAAASVRLQGEVRFVDRYHPAYRLEAELRDALVAAQPIPTQRYYIVVADKHRDKPALGAAIQAMGGKVEFDHPGSLLFEVRLDAAQLLAAANLDQVLWIDRWTAVGLDMNNARIQGGGNYVESQGGYTGLGLNAHIYEGIDANHPAYSGPVINVRSSGASSSHGTNTAGIVFGDGTGNPTYRGMAPDVGKFYTNYGSVQGSRWQVVSDLVNIHNVSMTTASWGDARTTQYTSVSADADDIIFDHDIAWTQSQSNASTQQSRPQAWAKNIFSIGGVDHNDNSNPLDDSWRNGGASIGPASDGRIKPTLCAYYDSIGTTSQGGGYTGSFGGTSGATPIVAGHNALAIQMFTDGIFGNQLRNPGGSRHSNRPKFTTLKALQVVSAAQYAFTSGSSDNRREHQGWGFPDLRRMYDYRAKTFIVDESDVLAQGQNRRWDITVGAGEPDLKICMTYADPAGNPAASMARVNDLSLRVVDPNGTVYWGNNGLSSGVWSVAGGTEDNLNPIECVFVQNPVAGMWRAEVFATLVAQDSHVETPGVDADYGLVVSGGTGQGGGSSILGKFEPYGSGCAGGTCPSFNGAGGTLTGQFTQHEYAFKVINPGTLSLAGFELFSRSSGGTQSVSALIYSDVGGAPSSLPISGGILNIGPTTGFHPGTFGATVTLTGDFWIGINHTGGTTAVSELTAGQTTSVYRRAQFVTGTWGVANGFSRPSYRLTCAVVVPRIGNSGVATVNRSFAVNLADAPTGALALLALGFSDTALSGGTPLPYPLPNAPGCDLFVSWDDWASALTDGSGSASVSLSVPNLTSLVNTNVFHQWLVSDPGANTLGVVVSDAAKTTIGS